MVREVDGLKVAFVSSESYFQGFGAPSMVSTARATGADIVILLAPSVSGDSLTDNEIRALLGLDLQEVSDHA